MAVKPKIKRITAKEADISKIKKVKDFIDYLEEGVIALNEKNKLVFINKSAKSFLKCTNNKCDISFFDNRKKKINFNQALKTKKVREFLQVTIKKNKKPIFSVDCLITKLKDEAGKNPVYLIVFHNLTKTEQTATLGNDSISIASHHLRTPLSAVKWFLEMLMSGDAGQLNSKQMELVHEIFVANGQMIELVNDLLSITVVEKGKVKLKKEKIDLQKVLNGVIDSYGYLASAKNVKLKKKFPNKKVNIVTDRKYLKVVLNNLLENAICYNKRAGEVVVYYELPKNNKVKIGFKDNGLGISPEDRKKIFSKFYRGKNVVVREPVGTGLGLYFCKRIIDTLKGKINFESELQHGTDFYIELPLK